MTKKELSVWQKLKSQKKPVVLYGTGDAADKIIKELDARGITVSGIFASDGFVRDRYYAGHKVLSYSDACGKFGDMCVVLCFGSHRPEIIENIIKISREQELYAPDLPVAGIGLFDRYYCEMHKDELNDVRSRLADDQSRFVFDSVIDYKLTGKIQPLLECSTPEKENWRLLFKSNLSKPDVTTGSAFGNDVKFCSALSNEREGLTFADLGAYTGDTADLFIDLYGGDYKKIIAVEPERRNFRKLTENLADRQGVSLINAACGSCDTTVYFRKAAGRGSYKAVPSEYMLAGESSKEVPQGFIKAEQRSLDSILGGQRADMIKMDIEGAEKEAIEGAENTIRQYAPNMLIAAYHRIEDLFAIPAQVLGLHPEYKLYLRKDPAIPAWGVNYFFIDK